MKLGKIIGSSTNEYSLVATPAVSCVYSLSYKGVKNVVVFVNGEKASFPMLLSDTDKVEINFEALGDFVVDFKKEDNVNIPPWKSHSFIDYKKLLNKRYDTETHIEMNVRTNGGNYIYSNHPESIEDNAVNKIIMRNENLTGTYFLTFEHQNHTQNYDYLYLGYRLYNPSSREIFVTVTNIGYQVSDSWLGDRSWEDFYGVKFVVDTNSFKQEMFNYDGRVYNGMTYFKDYLNFDLDYKPSPISITTYIIPPFQYLYIIGGTSSDACFHTSVNHSADLKIKKGCCANGNVKFEIERGFLIGDLVVYDDPKNIDLDSEVLWMYKASETDDLGGRLGFNHIDGVVDMTGTFHFDDSTKEFKVYYDSYYPDDDLKNEYEPGYELKNLKPHRIHSNMWKSHLSSLLHHDYIGTDLVKVYTKYQNEYLLQSDTVANPAGKIWDFGNWMVEYQENFVLVNHGLKTRNINVFITNPGSLFYIIKDENNNIIKAGATTETATGIKPIYTVDVDANSYKVIRLYFVLPANDNGSVFHYLTFLD